MKLASPSYTGQEEERYMEKIYLSLSLVVVFLARNPIVNVSILRVLFFRLSEYNLQCSRAATQKNTNFDNTGLSNFLKT